MVKNNIKTMRESAGMKQADLVRIMADAGIVSVLSCIETGRAMPTRSDMASICARLGCSPNDLYDESDLDISGSTGSQRSKSKRRNAVEIRVRLKAEEKRELIEAVAYLGYRDTSEWLQKMRVATVHKSAARCKRRLKWLQGTKRAKKRPQAMREHGPRGIENQPSQI